MSLVDSIVTNYTRAGTHHVQVAGLSLWNVVSGNVHFSLDSPVPDAALTMSTIHSWIKRGDSVIIDWEYDGFTKRIFTGSVKRRKHETGQGTLECVGNTSKLYRPFQVLPITFASITAENAVKQILASVGITHYALTIAAWTLGTIQPAVIDLKSPGDAIQHIIEVGGHRQFELPTGTFVVIPLLEVPAPTPFRTYKTTAGTNPRIVDISDDEDEDQVKKKVYVSGATLISTDAEGNEIQAQIGGQDQPIYAETLSDDLVVGDPELFSMQQSNDLIQDAAKAGAEALRLLDKYHRVIERISFTVPLDPEIQLAMCIGIEDATVTGRTSRWFVNGYTHTWGPSNAETQLDLFGGDQSGTTGNLAPIVDFIQLADRELIGTGEKLVVTFVSAAYDLDGTIADLHWTDNYAGGAMNQHGAAMTVVTRVYDPAVDDSVDVTLAVTDDKGLISTLTKTVAVAAGSQTGDPPRVPNIVAASYNTHMLTPDGGFNWHDWACASGHSVSVGAFNPTAPGENPILLFGTDNGLILRSTDALATAPAVAMTADLNSQINDIFVMGEIPGRAYACTEAGYLYRTDDYGATWVCTRAACGWPLKMMSGGWWYSIPGVLYVYGGAVTADPATWYTLCQWSGDGGYTFTSAPIAGELGTDLAGATGAYTVVVAAAWQPEEMCIGLWGAGTLEPHIYFTSNFHHDGTQWKRAIGLTAGLTVPRALAANPGASTHLVLFFDDRDSWVTTDGINWTKNAGVLLPGVTAFHLVQTYPYQDVFIGAAQDGLIKSTDACTTVDYIRPIGGISTWPVGAIGRKVCFMAEGLPKLVSLAMATLSGAGAPTRLQTQDRAGDGYWTKQSDEAVGTVVRNVKLFRFPGMTAGVRFRCRATAPEYDGNVWLVLQRSPDNGVTWTDTSVTRCPFIDRGPDGTLWAIGDDAHPYTHCIYKSTDEGVTWVLVYTSTYQAPWPYNGSYDIFNQIRVDPTNPLRIMAIGESANIANPYSPVVAVSLDGGTSWTRKMPTFPHSIMYLFATPMVLLAAKNNRWVAAYNIVSSTSTHYILVSDDDGTTWVSKSTLGGTTASNHFIQSMNAGLHLYVLTVGDTGPVVLARSKDNGETWEDIALPALPAPYWGICAMAFDGANNRLFVGAYRNGYCCYVCTNPQPTGNLWISLVDNIATSSGYAYNYCAYAGLAAL